MNQQGSTVSIGTVTSTPPGNIASSTMTDQPIYSHSPAVSTADLPSSTTKTSQEAADPAETPPTLSSKAVIKAETSPSVQAAVTSRGSISGIPGKGDAGFIPSAPLPKPVAPVVSKHIGLGITWSPYHADRSCKSQDETDADFATFQPAAIVRVYGVDCQQVTMAIAAAETQGMKVFLGLTDIDHLQGDLQSLINQVSGNWSIVNTISIGNELVNYGTHSVSDVVGAINTARGILGGSGYQGNAVIVDTCSAIVNNPQLCEASDYVAANCHSFFDPNNNADNAGPWVQNWVGQLENACHKRVVITESGWPHAGQANGDAVPSPENQVVAIASLKSTFSSDFFLFTAFDDLWKAPGAFDVEQSWGIYGLGH